MATDSARRAIVMAVAGVAASGAAAMLTPSRRASELLQPIELDRQVPETFGRWRVDKSIRPVLPDPGVQAQLDVIYTQVLARTYIDDQGRRVMLSIAYGSDQGSDATAVHRPEFCYTGQGFSVRDRGEDVLQLPDHQIAVRRLVGRMQARVEPITYWITLNDRAALPGLRRKLEQIRLGLGGVIPDGMLFRLSSIQPEATAAYRLQDEFAVELSQAMSLPIRARYFGRPA